MPLFSWPNIGFNHVVAALFVCSFLGFCPPIGALEPSIVVPESRGTYRGRPVVYAVHVEQGPRVDGFMDDEAWRRAAPAGELIQYDPLQNTPHSQRTEFRVLYDANNLYVGVWCFDSEPERIITHTMERDAYMRSEDYISIVLDTFHDRRNGYNFSTNPNGARADSSISNNINKNRNWDGAWGVRTSTHSWGWGAEFSIPFKTLSFSTDTPEWGINLYRSIGRLGERGLWANARAEVHYYNVSEAGDLKGLHGLKQGKGLDISPYFTGKYAKDRTDDDSDRTGEFGADVRYRLTPSMTSIFSVNTDFAETEIDERQLNLTRYPLFFPEKRAFFLEDAGIFGFGGGESSSRRREENDTLLMPFFSRRIGLSRNGEVVPIHFASKLTGRVKNYNIGIMDAVLEGEGHPRNAFVGRVSRNLFEQSSTGLFATVGDPNSDEMNAVVGSDFQYRSSDFMGGGTLMANTYILGAYSEELGSGMEPAWGSNVRVEDRDYTASAGVVEIGDEFDPAMGFVRRRGIRRYNVSGYYTPKFPDVSWLRNSRHGYKAELYTGLDNDLVSTKQTFAPSSFYLESQDYVFLEFYHYTDRPDIDFEISDGSVISAGDYEWWESRFLFYSSRRRKVHTKLSYSVGGFYDGIRQQYGLDVEYRPWSRLAIGGEYTMNQIDWDDLEDSNIQLASASLKYSWTPDLTLYNLLQYDNVTSSVGINSRLQWEYQPGAKMYFVINQGYVDEETGLVMRNLETAVKVGALFRF